VDADGTDPVRVARVDATSLSWSADGRRIAFTRHFRADSDIWLMNADGSNMRRLKRTPELFERDVDWSPVGGRIAFVSGGYVPLVYVMRTDGSGLRKLAPPATLRGWPDSTDPDWSPDGRRIVFASVAGPGTDPEIWVMNANGKRWVRLTENRFADGQPVWSPDGRRIAFSREFAAIHVMNADGTGETRLTAGAYPAWQPAPLP
jgi:TolB protein